MAKDSGGAETGQSGDGEDKQVPQVDGADDGESSDEDEPPSKAARKDGSERKRRGLRGSEEAGREEARSRQGERSSPAEVIFKPQSTFFIGF